MKNSKLPITFLSLTLLLHANVASSQNSPLKILLDPPPITLNPRASLDATGQRINELLFRGLTHLDANLVPHPDLAESWEILDSGKTWKFSIRPNLKDHALAPIRAEELRACLENYRVGRPTSAFQGALPNWKSTTVEGNRLVLRFEKPAPYLARDLSLLRYFRVPERTDPCAEPLSESALIGNGDYRAEKWDLAPDGQFTLIPVDQTAGRRTLEFIFSGDEDTKSLKLLRGEVDAIHLGLSLTKTRWIQKAYAEKFKILERPGVTVSYLTFNFKDPLLARKEVRRAIALSLDRASMVQYKHLGVTTLASSLLSPSLPESISTPFEFNPSRAEKLLDEAGLPRKKDGIRFTLHYKTTPVREGGETALMFQEMLGKVGIQIVIDVVEPAVFFALVRKGSFQLFSSRWIGVADGSILYNTLRSGQHLNRINYHDPEMDRLLDQAIAEPDVTRRRIFLRQAQLKMAENLPYLPLWFWNVGTLLRNGLQGLTADQLSLSGSLEPLTHLR